ncbi:MAG: tetratricopeptide repeat protein [Bacteroidales bacterium]|nr:tetratricopeptide repeat protein [Bacteroidales bacterium]
MPCLDNEIVNWDDNVYITNNIIIHSLSQENIKILFSNSFEGHYHPITLFSFAIDYHFFKTEAWFYHFFNLLLHLLNTILVFFLVRKLFKSVEIAGITALLFGIHPMLVESVAWITARKDVLFAVFFLLSLNTYVIYIKKNNAKIYFLSFFLFLFSVLSKGQAISLSITLFVIDYLLGRNLLSKKVIIEKIPFIAISIIFGIITIYAQKETGYSGESNLVLPIHQRIAYACFGFCMYIYKLILPINLSAYYPYPLNATGSIPVYIYFFIISASVVLGILVYYFKRSKSITFGILFFIINIVLMLKLFPVANFIIADRYAYIPSIGLFIIIGIIVNKVLTSWIKWRKLLIVIIVIYGILLGFLSFNRVEIWQNSFTLLDDILSKYPHVVTALNSRGDARAESGDLQGALSDFSKAVEYDPMNNRGYRNRALVKYRLSDYNGSVTDYNTAIEINPYDAITFLNRGLSKEKLNDIDGALSDFNKSIEIDPEFAEAYNNRGSLKSRSGKLDAALLDYNKAIQIRPDFAKAYANRAKVKNKRGNFKEALTDVSNAIRLGFDHTELYFEKGYSLYNLRQFKNAIDAFNKAIMMKETFSKSYLYRGYAKNNIGDFSGAVSDLDIGLKSDPTNAIAYGIRGIAKIKSGKKESGCRDLHAAEKLGLLQARSEIERYCYQE